MLGLTRVAAPGQLGVFQQNSAGGHPKTGRAAGGSFAGKGVRATVKATGEVKNVAGEEQLGDSLATARTVPGELDSAILHLIEGGRNFAFQKKGLTGSQ